jgi:hypothetical protein
MRRYPNLDAVTLIRRSLPSHVLINKTDKVLHPIQNGLNLKLNGWFLLGWLCVS